MNEDWNMEEYIDELVDEIADLEQTVAEQRGVIKYLSSRLFGDTFSDCQTA